jgi:hypothetical protein
MTLEALRLTHTKSGAKVGSGAVASSIKDHALNDTQPRYILRWSVEGNAGIDYFNVYFVAGSSDSSARLVGQTALPVFVTNIDKKFVFGGKVRVCIQPVLSATSLPLPWAMCVQDLLVVP